MRALLLALVLTPPVAAPQAERFHYGPDPFARGAHRGLDFSSVPGAPVRAACDGVVVHAGPVAGEEVVSLRCGVHRVSLVGVRASVRAGARVRPGQRVGSATGEVHLGVRREGEQFGYLDPARFIRAPRTAPPAGPGVPLAPFHPTKVEFPSLSEGELDFRPVAPPAPAPEPAPRERHLPLAPPAAWLGLAALLLATTARRRKRAPIASPRRWPSTSRPRSTT